MIRNLSFSPAFNKSIDEEHANEIHTQEITQVSEPMICALNLSHICKHNLTYL